MIATPYLLLPRDTVDGLAAVIAKGTKDWRPEFAIGQLRMPGCNADMHLPDMTMEQARAAGRKTIVIGVANPACVATDVAINTYQMDKAVARAHLAHGEDRMGLPATDPFRFGAGGLVDGLIALS
jgi:uncharacterized NAD-dependent epimerase/dehydratase family protein